MDYVGRNERRKKGKKLKKKNGHVASEIYWCEINNKNKWHMYLSKGVLN